MALKNALVALNQLKDDGIIGDYAICGGYACSFYGIGIPTYDLDVLIVLPSDEDFHRLYVYFQNKNAKIENVYIYIGDMPIQFLPNYISPLHHEAISKAKEVKFEGVTSKFVSIEHLIALLLTAFRYKDKMRVEILLDYADKEVLLDIIRRFDNGQLHKRYKQVLASKGTV